MSLELTLAARDRIGKRRQPGDEVTAASDPSSAGQRRTLSAVLAINLAQCLAGVVVGLWAGSTALIAAALDNLADASVYGLSLYAVGRSERLKVLSARLSGWLLIALSGGVAIEAMRRFFWGEPPVGPAMMAMATVNAGLNLICLRLLTRHRGGGVHFKASAIFTSNDTIVNVGIVLSGALVILVDSNVPDLVVGICVAAVAARGGMEILEEATEAEAPSAGGRDI